MSPVAPSARFHLTRRFAVAAFLSVLAVATALGAVLSRVLHDRLLERDAEVTSEFVQSIVRTDETAPFFRAAVGAPLGPTVEDSFRHFAQMPDVLRANVYTPDRRALWSSDRALIGKTFGANEELDGALAGRPMWKSGPVSKEEHAAGAKALRAGGDRRFVEIYAPVRDGSGQVLAVVELYKTPDALFQAIADGQRTIALASALGGLALFAALFGVVRRADRVLRDQQRRLVEGERLGAVGEMAATVAHAIRNPLSSIRTSVEVAVDNEGRGFGEQAEDIVAEVDKVEEWLRQLLAFSRPGHVAREPIDPNAIARKALANAARETARRGVHVVFQLAEPPPPATGDAAIVEHVLVSLVANAVDAMKGPGRLDVETRGDAQGAEILVGDSGPGLGEEELKRLFEPFFTTKTRGTGLGLALASRIVERMGGRLTLENRPQGGALARLRLPGPERP